MVKKFNKLANYSILSASEPRRKKSRWLDESAYFRKINREEKNTKLSGSSLLMKSLWSDAVRWLKDKYVRQQQLRTIGNPVPNNFVASHKADFVKFFADFSL